MRPCVAEEIGTLAPNVANEKTAAQYIRNTLWTLWAHDNLGLWWWCAFDQESFDMAPYDWREPGLEHGIMTADRRNMPIADTLRGFAAFLRAFDRRFRLV